MLFNISVTQCNVTKIVQFWYDILELESFSESKTLHSSLQYNTMREYLQTAIILDFVAKTVENMSQTGQCSTLLGNAELH